MNESRPLTTLIVRMRKTLINSCVSECVFSVMKVIHTTVRNRLTPERINKLLFIQINQRVLKRGTSTESNAQNEESVEEIESEGSMTEAVPQLQPIDAIKALQANRNAEEGAEDARALRQGPQRVENMSNRTNMDILDMLYSAGTK